MTAPPWVNADIEVSERDNLVFYSWSSAVVGFSAYVHFRPMSGAKPYSIQLDVLNVGDRSRKTVNKQITEDGFIDGVAIFATRGTAASAAAWDFPGRNYVQLFLTNGAVLAAGYVYSGHTPGLHDILPPGPLGGHGWTNTFDLTDPAAGLDYPAVPVPAGAMWKVKAMKGVLVASGVAGNRFFHIQVSDATPVTFGDWPADAVQGPGATVQYNGFVGISPKTAIISNRLYVSFDDLFLLAGYTLTPTTDLLDAGDNWGHGYLEVEEWTMPS